MAVPLRELVGFKLLKSSLTDQLLCSLRSEELKSIGLCLRSDNKNSQTQYSFCYFQPV